MDLQLKQWRNQQQQNESEEQPSAAKLPNLVFDQSQTAASTALPLFVPEPTSSRLSSLSGFSPDPPPRFPRMGSYFSFAQWQELELQALIYRYMLAGAAVPPELIQPIKRSLLHHSPSCFLHHPLQPFSHCQPAWYWGRAAMDPEPGRCRRTDGKKWRCSRDVVAGHKYCERHMHRGRNRSRKPVEVPTPNSASNATASTTSAAVSSLTFGGSLRTNADGGPIGGGSQGPDAVGNAPSFFFSGASPSTELFHLSRSCSETKRENNNRRPPYEGHNGFGGNRSDGGHILRHFFDDWPRPLQEHDGASSPMNSATCLSISMPGNSSSDVSLKLSTGNEEDDRSNNNSSIGREHMGLNWGTGAGSHHQNHHHHHHQQMGGPLAEALRSSAATLSSSSSPTSVLHQLGITNQALH